MLQIKGFEKLTLIDFPGHIAAIIFLGECNFRCDYCYNKDLVCRPEQLPTFDEQAVLDLLSQRRNFLEGVVITGGEATLQASALKKFLPQIRSLGLRIKLDSNGYLPEKITELIPLVDYIAMDIKAPLERYGQIVGRDVHTERIAQSVAIIKASGVAYEFRTTVWKNAFSLEDFRQMFELIAGAPHYYLQNMYPFFTIQPQQHYEPMSKYDITPVVSLAQQYVSHVHLRGTWL